MAAVVVGVRKHFVFLNLSVDSCVLTTRENIYEIQLVRNSLQLNVIYVDDRVHVYVNVEYKATRNQLDFGFFSSMKSKTIYFSTLGSEFHFDYTRCWTFP